MEYAQIDATGRCFAVSQLAGPVDDPALIEISDGQQALGKRWDGAMWHVLPQVPINASSIPRRQGRLALLTYENISENDILAVIDLIEDPLQREIASIEFKDSQQWELSNVWLGQIALALGISEVRLQELFNIAATL